MIDSDGERLRKRGYSCLPSPKAPIIYAGGKPPAKIRKPKGDIFVKKRLLKTAIATAMTLAVAAPAFAAANPFSDVPAKHWAYDAVNKLAQAGIVDGYGDGTFRGDKTMTRYEMATIVAKAMTKDLNADQKAVTDKLAQEFGTELNSLGVKVTSLQNQVDNMVKFSGDARVRYINGDYNDTGAAMSDKFDYRVRLGATAKINDDMSLYARLNSGNMNPAVANSATAGVGIIENAYVNFKALGFDGKIGRQDVELGQGMLAGGASNAIANGLSLKAGGFMAYGGKEQSVASTYDDVYAAQYGFKLGLPITASYLNLNDVEYASAGTSFDLVKGLKISGEYAKNITAKADAYQVKAAFGNTGLSVAYKDVEAKAVPFDSALNLKTGMNDFYAVSAAGRDAKGYEIEYNRAIAKNTNLNLLFQDIDNEGQNVRATASVKF